MEAKRVGFRSLITDPKVSQDLLRLLVAWEANYAACLIQGLLPQHNFDGRFVSFTSSSSANAENTIAHTLGRVPSYWIVVDVNKAAKVYRDGTTWTSTNIYLKCDTASTAVTVWIF